MSLSRDRYLAEVTSGLKGDPELRLDVRAELASHLDAAGDAARDTGLTEEQAAAHAIQSLGSPVTLAGDLARANRRRMKLRGLVRLSVAFLLVPAAVVLAVVMGKTAMDRARTVYTLASSVPDTLPTHLLGSLTQEQAEQRMADHWGLSRRDRLIVFGDGSRSDKSDRQKALCDLEPTNCVFYANYIRHRLTDYDGRRIDLPTMLGDLRKGEQLDPGNAFYNYLIADVLFKGAGSWSNAPGPHAVQEFVVRDTNLLDQALVELGRGVDKPFCRTHIAELLALRRSLLPASDNVAEEVMKIGMAAGTLLPHVSMYRDIAKVCVERARDSVAKGRPDEVRRILAPLVPFVEDMTQDSWSLIEVLVAHAVNNMVRQKAVPILEQAGFAKEAAGMRLEADAIAAPVQAWRASVTNSSGRKWENAGVLAGMLLPAVGDEGITDADLAPGRHLDQILVEQSAVMLLIAAFLLAMAVAGLLVFRWRRVGGADAAPFLIVPHGRKGLVILLVSVVLPVILYMIYTRYSGLAGREVGFARNLPRILVELGSLALFIFVSSVWLSLRHVKQRCRTLGVPVPETRRRAFKAWVAVWLSDYGLYLGTAARSLVPVFAVAILFLGGVIQPWLLREETRWLRADPLIFQGSDIGGFTTVETRLVNRLRNAMLEGALNVERPTLNVER